MERNSEITWFPIAQPCLLGEQGEARLHLAALDGVQRARHPVGAIVLDGAAVGVTGLRRAEGLGAQVILERR